MPRGPSSPPAARPRRAPSASGGSSHVRPALSIGPLGLVGSRWLSLAPVAMPPRLRKESKSDYHARRMALRSGPTVLLAPARALPLATASCRGCHDDHPYVPYAIGLVSPVGDSPGDAAAATV